MARKCRAPCTRVSAIRIYAVCGVAATDPVREVLVLCVVWVTAELLPWIGSVVAM